MSVITARSLPVAIDLRDSSLYLSNIVTVQTLQVRLSSERCDSNASADYFRLAADNHGYTLEESDSTRTLAVALAMVLQVEAEYERVKTALLTQRQQLSSTSGGSPFPLFGSLAK